MKSRTQYDMKGPSIGLLKMDFLGRRRSRCSKTPCMIEQNRGVEIDLTALTLDDEAPTSCSPARATAIFQFESHGMRDILRHLPAHAPRRPHRAERPVPPDRQGGMIGVSSAASTEEESRLRPARAEGNFERPTA
jgi:hypothetical protein